MRLIRELLGGPWLSTEVASSTASLDPVTGRSSDPDGCSRGWLALAASSREMLSPACTMASQAAGGRSGSSQHADRDGRREKSLGLASNRT